MIFIVHLKSLLVNVDFYQRLKFNDENFSLIIMKNNDSTFYYKIKRLLNQRTFHERI